MIHRCESHYGNWHYKESRMGGHSGGNTLIWNYNYGVQNFGGGSCSGKNTGFWGGFGLGLGAALGNWLMGGMQQFGGYMGNMMNSWMPSFDFWGGNFWSNGWGDASGVSSSSSSRTVSSSTARSESSTSVVKSEPVKTPDPATDLPLEQDTNPPVTDTNPPVNHTGDEIPNVSEVIAKLKQCSPSDTYGYGGLYLEYVDDKGFTVSCSCDENGNLLAGQYTISKNNLIYQVVNFNTETEELEDYYVNDFENLESKENGENDYTACTCVFRNSSGVVTGYQEDNIITRRTVWYKPSGDVDYYHDNIYYDEICREVHRDGSGKLIDYTDYQRGVVTVTAEIDGESETQTMTYEEFEEGKPLTFGI